MSVYKEMGYLVRKIQKNSVQIYPDAADCGVPVKSYDDEIVKLVAGVCKDQYQLEPKTVEYSTGATQTFNFDGGWPAVLEAGFEKADIVFVRVRGDKNLKGYIYATTETSPSANRKAQEYDY